MAVALFAAAMWMTSTAYPSAAERGALAASLTALMVAVAWLPGFVAPFADRWVARHRRTTRIAADLTSIVVVAAWLALHLRAPLPPPVLLVGFAVLAVVRALGAAAYGAPGQPLPMHVPGAGAVSGARAVWTGVGVTGTALLAAALLAAPRWAHQGVLPSLRVLSRLPDGLVLCLGFSALSFLVSGVAAGLAPLPRVVSSAPLASVPLSARPRSQPRQRGWSARMLASVPVMVFAGLFPIAVRDAVTATPAGSGASLEGAIALVAAAAGVGVAIGGTAVPDGATATARGMGCGRGPLLAGTATLIAFALVRDVMAMAAVTTIAAALLTIAARRTISAADEASDTTTLPATSIAASSRPSASAARVVGTSAALPLVAAVAGAATFRLPAGIVIALAAAIVAVGCAVDVLFGERCGRVPANSR